MQCHKQFVEQGALIHYYPGMQSDRSQDMQLEDKSSVKFYPTSFTEPPVLLTKSLAGGVQQPQATCTYSWGYCVKWTTVARWEVPWGN